eukprot:3203616-Alexandrium_andersonii.AAC.1
MLGHTGPHFPASGETASPHCTGAGVHGLGRQRGPGGACKTVKEFRGGVSHRCVAASGARRSGHP